MNSMTGYAAVRGEFAGQHLSLDLRAVNSRYLEIVLRGGDELRPIESVLRERIRGRVVRGKLECRIALSPAAKSAGDVQLNSGLLEQLAQWLLQIRQHLPDVAPFTAAEVLHWPGMLPPQIEQPGLQEASLALLDQALSAFAASRQREGAKLADYLSTRLDSMELQIVEIAPYLPQLIAAYQQKLRQRYLDLMADADDDRVMQELALFAQKIDVDEELSRLRAHIEAVRLILRQEGAVGKQLDFMMQELNREANTLGSKSVSVETTRVAMNLKVLIEQMREQVQNIE